MGGIDVFEQNVIRASKRGPRRLSPFFIPMSITNMQSGFIAIEHGFTGPNFSISTACATGNFCIVEGAHVIERGDADVVVVGGSEAPITMSGIGGFAAQKAFSNIISGVFIAIFKPFRVGDRIRCYLLDVRKETKGPQIILSRVNPDFMVKLFAMEVPEIYEGIVEVKSASREPGVRSKIAVVSKDSQVDPVGACVGMKGSRVQSVVQELKGEKIDIVAWDEDIANYVCNALSPAEVVRVIVDEDNRTIEVVVPDDQLSLAIGKKGQNVRLASQLIGWSIDINTESTSEKVSLDDQLEEELAAAKALEQSAAVGEADTSEGLQAEAVAVPGVAAEADIETVPGVGGKTASILKEAGLDTVGVLADKSVDDLEALPGIGKKKAESILAAAKEQLGA